MPSIFFLTFLTQKTQTLTHTHIPSQRLSSLQNATVIITEFDAASAIQNLQNSIDLSSGYIRLIEMKISVFSNPICDAASETNLTLLEREATRK